eukprot:m.31868 g.31868  ORF g.31868 m.31868 type:complete len:845 (-) comp9348_c1_seq1:30-2564(-)
MAAALQAKAVVKVMRGCGLVPKDVGGSSDPYVKGFLGPRCFQTSFKPNTLAPVWDEEFTFTWDPAELNTYITLEVWDQDQFNADDFMGCVLLPVATAPSLATRAWFRLGLDSDHRDLVTGWLLLDVTITNPAAHNDEFYANFHRACTQHGFYLPLPPAPPADPAALAPAPIALAEMTRLPGASVLPDDTSQSEGHTPSHFGSCRPAPAPPATLPDKREVIELSMQQLIVTQSRRRAVCDVLLTDYRLVIFSSGVLTDHTMRMQSNTKINTYVPLGFIISVSLSELKGHVAVKGQDAVAGSVQEGGNVITIVCRDFRAITIRFPTDPLWVSQAKFFLRRLQYHALNHVHQPAAFLFGNQTPPHLWELYQFSEEFSRQGLQMDLPEQGDASQWMPLSNDGYELCGTYPPHVVIPRSLGSNIECLVASAAFRGKERLPVLCYYNKRGERSGNALMRCAQPHVGMQGRRCREDEQLILAARKCSDNQNELHIFDARSLLAVKGNKLIDGGAEGLHYESVKYYYMEIANIHAVRASHEALLSLITSGSEDSWLSSLERTAWLGHIASILSAANVIARKMVSSRMTCLVHCSDGWDRTPQLTSLAQLLLDKYYRTMKGFAVLVEKEWLSFGHRFTDRLGIDTQRSPVFLQFLDCVWQILQQFPSAFEFNSAFLVALADHHQSAWFGTFLLNCDHERRMHRLSTTTSSVWAYMETQREHHRNLTYRPDSGVDVLSPHTSTKWLALWADYFLRYDYSPADAAAADEDGKEVHATHAQHNLIVWEPDHHAAACRDCGLAFGTLRRRHHCRACGQIFCHSCSRRTIPLPSFGYPQPERVCDRCFDMYNAPVLAD